MVPSMFSTPGSPAQNPLARLVGSLGPEVEGDRGQNNRLVAFEYPPIAQSRALQFQRHGHGINEGENVMNRERDEQLIDLGVASDETKGGPYGSEDFWGTLMTKDLGLTED